MKFVYIEFFWLLLPLLTLGVILFRHQEKLSYIFDEKVLKRLRASDEGISMKIRNSLMLLAILFLIIALARPVEEKGDKKVEVEGLTMLCALDISGSMRVKMYILIV